MRPLSGFLITMMQTALETRATHVDVLLDDGAIQWLHGTELVGTAALPDDSFAPFADELNALGASPRAISSITIQSPIGPLSLTVDLTSGKRIRVVLRDERTADAEAGFGELMARLVEIGADRVTCTTEEARFANGARAIESIPLSPGALPLLLAHGKQLAGLVGDARSGGAVLFGGGTRRALRVDLLEDGIVFTVTG